MINQLIFPNFLLQYNQYVSPEAVCRSTKMPD